MHGFGAGAAARVSIGITVFSGMIASTCLAVALVPIFFVKIEGFFDRRAAKQALKKEARKAKIRAEVLAEKAAQSQAASVQVASDAQSSSQHTET